MRLGARMAVLAAAGVLAIAGIAVGDARSGPPEIRERGMLRVCADGNNLPFSNRSGEGFENKIAEMMAEDLGIPLTYVWAPQIMGFVRNTLDMHVCDVIVGVAAGYEFVQNTNAYYRSVYAFVVRADSDLRPASLTAPELKGRKIGVISETPPLVPLRRTGAQVKGYLLQTDTRVVAPVRDAVADVAEGETEAAVLWGPIAGYYAAERDEPLEVLPLVEDASGARLDFRITMGIRRGEPQWKDWINDFIERRQGDIDEILAAYGVPILDRRGDLVDASALGDGE